MSHFKDFRFTALSLHTRQICTPVKAVLVHMYYDKFMNYKNMKD